MNIEDFTKKYIPLLLAYSTICSGVWALSYWSTFDINIFPFLELADILKSFIKPLILSGLYIAYIAFFPNFLIRDFVIGTNNNKPLYIRYPGYHYIIMVIVNISGFSLYFLSTNFYLKYIIAPVIFYILAIVNLVSNSFFDEYFKSKTQKFAFFSGTLSFIIISLLIGKYSSHSILINKEYEMWVNKSAEYNKEDTLKFLGKAGDFYLFTTLNNKKNIIKKIDEVKTLELVTIKKKVVN